MQTQPSAIESGVSADILVAFESELAFPHVKDGNYWNVPVTGITEFDTAIGECIGRTICDNATAEPEAFIETLVGMVRANANADTVRGLSEAILAALAQVTV